MKTYYIVQEKGSEYNDEIYDLRDEGGTPVKVFAEKAEAEIAADKLNWKKLMSEPIVQYAYDISDVINNMGEFLNILNTTLNLSLTEEEITDDYEWSLPEMTYAQYKKVKSFIILNFYEIAECQGE